MKRGDVLILFAVIGSYIFGALCVLALRDCSVPVDRSNERLELIFPTPTIPVTPVDEYDYGYF